MSEQEQNSNREKVEEPVSDDARIQIKPKDASEQLLPGGKNVNELSNEEYATYTSNMVKADRLYEKHTEPLSDADREVFDALLLASDQSLSVEERFKLTSDKFNAVKSPKEDAKEEETKAKETAPPGNMDAPGRNTSNPINKLEPENDAPLGDDEDYFKFLQERFRKQTTLDRNKIN